MDRIFLRFGKTIAQREWDSIEKAFSHKYIKRIPTGKTDRPWYYIYAETFKKPFKALAEIFGINQKRVDDDYEKENIKKDYGVDKTTFAAHILEYFTNREKWNKIFGAKENREKYKKPVQQKELVEAVAKQTGKKPEAGKRIINRSLMKKVWSIYSPEGRQIEQAEKESEAEAHENRSQAMMGNQNEKFVTFGDGTKVLGEDASKVQQAKVNLPRRKDDLEDARNLLKKIEASYFPEKEELMSHKKEEIAKLEKLIARYEKTISDAKARALAAEGGSGGEDEPPTEQKQSVVVFDDKNLERVKQSLPEGFSVNEKEGKLEAMLPDSFGGSKHFKMSIGIGDILSIGKDFVTIKRKNDELNFSRSTSCLFVNKGENSEWGKVYGIYDNEALPLDCANFLKEKQDGLVKGVFVGRNKRNKKSYDVGLCWGDENMGLCKIIEKHIIKQSDFETIDETMSAISDVLDNGNVKEFPTKIQCDNGKYRVVLAKTEHGHLVLTAFDKSKSDDEKIRTAKEQETKRKELNLLVPNSFTLEGTPLPETASDQSIPQPEEISRENRSQAMMGNQNARKDFSELWRSACVWEFVENKGADQFAKMKLRKIDTETSDFIEQLPTKSVLLTWNGLSEKIIGEAIDELNARKGSLLSRIQAYLNLDSEKHGIAKKDSMRRLFEYLKGFDVGRFIRDGMKNDGEKPVKKSTPWCYFKKDAGGNLRFYINKNAL